MRFEVNVSTGWRLRPGQKAIPCGREFDADPTPDLMDGVARGYLIPVNEPADLLLFEDGPAVEVEPEPEPPTPPVPRRRTRRTKPSVPSPPESE